MNAYCDYQTERFCRKHGYTGHEREVVGEAMAFAVRYGRYYDSRREFAGALEQHLREQREQRRGMDPIISMIGWFIVKQIVWLVLEWCWTHIRFTSAAEMAAWRPEKLDPNANVPLAPNQ